MTPFATPCLVDRIEHDGPDEAHLVRSLMAAIGPRADVLVARKIRRGPKPTLQALGGEMGVTRERVRQIEAKALEAAHDTLASDRFSGLRRRAAELRRAIGVAAVGKSPEVRVAIADAVRGLEASAGCDPVDLLLWLAGPYDDQRGWLIREGTSLAELDRAFAAGAADRLVVDEHEVVAILRALHIVPAMWPAFLQRLPGWRCIDGGTVVRWSGGVTDKAEVVLQLVGRPCSVDEINAHIGEGHSPTSLRTRLFDDERFRRTDKAATIGLAEWGVRGYHGVAHELARLVAGTPDGVPLDELITDLVTQFGVSPLSVRAFAGTPAFVLEHGRLRLRGEHEPYEPSTRVSAARGVYVKRDGSVIVHVVVDKDILRGSGRQLAEPAAALLGMGPGDRREFSVGAGASLVVTWPPTSVSGPSLGSTRAIAARLGLADGDQVRLVFDPLSLTCTAARADTTSLEGMTGLSVTEGSELETLADALRVRPDTVLSCLTARGDGAVAALASRRLRWAA